MRENYAWAGGLFEGEGWWASGKKKYPTAALQMNDEDTVRKFASVFPFGKVYVRAGEKPRYTWAVYGHEKVQAFLAMVWPWIGTRRRSRAVEVLRLART